jgi:uncharacterized membrane protein
MNLHSYTRALSVVSLLSVFSTPALALDWTIKDLGNLGGDDQYAANVQDLARGINNQGQVVGWSITPTQIFREEQRNFLQPFVSAPNGGALTNLYTATTFVHGVPSTLDLETNGKAVAINDSGVVVFNADRFHALPAALYSAPPYTEAFPTGPNNGAFLQARDINNLGQVAGTQNYSVVAYRYSINDDSYYEFYDNEGNRIVQQATGINDSGQLSLNLLTESQAKAFIGSNVEDIRQIATRSEFNAATVGINNAGQVLGYESASSIETRVNTYSFLTGPDGMDVMYLDTFGGSFNLAKGLNNLGQVVGQAQDEFGIFHPYVTGPNGQGLLDLALEDDILNAGWTNISVAAINDLGQIAGTGDHNGVRRPFLLTPVPEPETYAMMLAGLSMLGFVRRRKVVHA